ncbi:hypothetical protein XENORESO_020499, partial [Xenotaenia resolanae]
ERLESEPLCSSKAKPDKLPQLTWSCAMKATQSSFSAGTSFQGHRVCLTCIHKTTECASTSSPPL